MLIQFTRQRHENKLEDSNVVIFGIQIQLENSNLVFRYLEHPEFSRNFLGRILEIPLHRPTPTDTFGHLYWAHLDQGLVLEAASPMSFLSAMCKKESSPNALIPFLKLLYTSGGYPYQKSFPSFFSCYTNELANTLTGWLAVIQIQYKHCTNNLEAFQCQYTLLPQDTDEHKMNVSVKIILFGG